ncbi:MAG: hypothetical protein WCA81_18925 [Rhizomicrobium sp.]
MNTLKSAFVIILLLFCGVALVPCRAADDGAALQARYDAAKTLLAKHTDSFSLDSTREGREALDEYWAAIQDWTVWYLNSHSQMSPKEISEHLETQELNGGVEVGAEKIGTDLYAVSAGYGEIGTVFLVAKRDGRFAVVWDIRHVMALDATKFPALTAWSTDHARDPCPSVKTDDGSLWDRCGPIHGGIDVLPPDSSGHIRFYIAATYAQAASETVAGQLSVWTWNGRTATPVLVKNYAYTIEDWRVGLKGSLLTIRVKDEYKMFTSAGCCAGRQMNWTFRVGPDHIDDLGMKPLIPELDAIDDLLFKVWHHLPTDAIAAPNVAATLASFMKAQQARGEFDPEFPTFGMFMGSSVQRGQQSTSVCLATDNDDAALLAFRMKHTEKGYFLSDVTKVPDGAKCPVHLAGAV